MIRKGQILMMEGFVLKCSIRFYPDFCLVQKESEWQTTREGEEQDR